MEQFKNYYPVLLLFSFPLSSFCVTTKAEGLRRREYNILLGSDATG